MRSVVLIALILACAFAFVEEAYAAPSDATTALPKEMKEPMEIKEPKEIKEAATASKDVKDAIKSAKDAKKMKKDCDKDCGTDYDPICVGDLKDVTFKPRTFASQCTLDVHNCEMGTKFGIISKGECPGSGGTRLF